MKLSNADGEWEMADGSAVGLRLLNILGTCEIVRVGLFEGKLVGS